MAIEISSSTAICSRCGKMYPCRKGNFPSLHGANYRGTGYLHICRSCMEKIYNDFLIQCSDPKTAARQVCRKLDLYWNEKVFDSVLRQSTLNNVMIRYVQKINISSYAGKSFDDTLIAEGILWDVNAPIAGKIDRVRSSLSETLEDEDDDGIVIPEEVVAYWGPGYNKQMYLDLEQRREYWMRNFPSDYEKDIGTEALIRQICALELDINRDRAEGKTVEKNVNALNTLLGSARLKPAQKKSEEGDSSLDKIPLGVWAQKLENERPIKEVDPELKDVDGIIKYISIWFLGHLCKMLGIKNTYCKLYEDEIKKRKVEHPEFEEEDDEAFFDDIFNSDPEDEES